MIIGISGGSASGKSTLAEALSAEWKKRGYSSAVIWQDWYYHDLPNNPQYMPGKTRDDINLDDPVSFDWQHFSDDLKKLKSGQSIQAPQYSYFNGRRTAETKHIEPKDFIIVDGLFLFCMDVVRKLFDYKIFVDAEEVVRRKRRIARDLQRTGNTLDKIHLRLDRDVIPMHNEYIEPSRQHVDLVLSNASNDLQILASEAHLIATNVLNLKS